MGGGKQAQGPIGTHWEEKQSKAYGQLGGMGGDRWGHWNIPEIGYQGELPWGQCSGYNVKTGS